MVYRRVGRARRGTRPPRRGLDDLRSIDDADADRLVRAGLDAGRRLARREPVAAHVALADDALARVKLRHVVRAGERAVLAAEALVVEVLDDPGDRVLLVGVDRAGVQAGRVEAVVAGRRDVLDDTAACAVAADEQADVAPDLVLVQPVQRVAGRHARLAARAAVEVDLEGVLLAGPGGCAGSSAR